MKPFFPSSSRHACAPLLACLLGIAALCDPGAAAPPEPLASWQQGQVKQAIVDFVAAVTDPASGQYRAATERIAVFDNDGTLWSEKPFYFQLYFALDRAREMAAADPDWADSPVRKAAAAGDIHGVLAQGEQGVLELVTATFAGMPVESYVAMARDWLATARHPGNGRRFVDMTFAPMVELLDYLRANGFQVYIVSGGGIDFIRAFAMEAYGVPPDHVIGSMGKASYGPAGAAPDVIKEAGIDFVDDGPGKPVGIMRHIGRRPIFVGGNSDGDFEMAEWASNGAGPHLAVIVHHTDAAREWAYDRDSAVGKLDKALDKEGSPGWVFVDMARDWKSVWPDRATAALAPDAKGFPR